MVMALPVEVGTSWYKNTISSLNEYKYEYIEMPSTPAAASRKTAEALGTKLRNANPRALGCWLSHLRAWSLQNDLNRPIISLEADTRATMPWTLNDTDWDWREYDILFLHNHPHQKVRCGTDKIVKVGIDKRYGAGAVLFTGRTPLSSILSTGLDTSLPIDHWFNFMENTHRLKIGTLCPSTFYQEIKKSSQIAA